MQLTIDEYNKVIEDLRQAKETFIRQNESFFHRLATSSNADDQIYHGQVTTALERIDQLLHLNQDVAPRHLLKMPGKLREFGTLLVNHFRSRPGLEIDSGEALRFARQHSASEFNYLNQKIDECIRGTLVTPGAREP